MRKRVSLARRGGFVLAAAVVLAFVLAVPASAMATTTVENTRVYQPTVAISRVAKSGLNYYRFKVQFVPEHYSNSQHIWNAWFNAPADWINHAVRGHFEVLVRCPGNTGYYETAGYTSSLSAVACPWDGIYFPLSANGSIDVWRRSSGGIWYVQCPHCGKNSTDVKITYQVWGNSQYYTASAPLSTAGSGVKAAVRLSNITVYNNSPVVSIHRTSLP